ncbi:unnamed protein product [Rodentolepis nana]|uniref:Uncharacterized protein n=1 Tax=Rodentolepis nana TaxID=102285 RepID=A0A0R3TYI1_RODNA|nr:unnamed protein product [Rodentolepis nana]
MEYAEVSRVLSRAHMEVLAVSPILEYPWQPISSDDRRAIDSSPTAAPTPRPRSTNFLPVSSSSSSSRSGDNGGIAVIPTGQNESPDVTAPPPRPPKPVMSGKERCLNTLRLPIANFTSCLSFR